MAVFIAYEDALREHFVDAAQAACNINILHASCASSAEEQQKYIAMAYLSMPEFKPENITRLFGLRSWYINWLVGLTQ